MLMERASARRRLWTVLTAGIIALSLGVNGFAAEVVFESIGSRAGFSANPGSRSGLFQAEAFSNIRLPWEWDLGKGCLARPRLELSAGGLTVMGDQSFVGTMGPSLIIRRTGWLVEFVGGSSPTILSRSAFGDWDLGSCVQFTSHAGLTFRVSPSFELSYRFQHMSNAGIDDDNPGLNLHMFSLACRLRHARR